MYPNYWYSQKMAQESQKWSKTWDLQGIEKEMADIFIYLELDARDVLLLF